MHQNKILKEAWNTMHEGMLDAAKQAVTNIIDPTSTNVESNPNQVKIDNILQQIRDIDTKIAPMLEKKRNLENQLAKLKK